MNSTKALLVTAGVMALSCLDSSCKKEAPQEPPQGVSVQLSVEDASCTEAWLKVSLTDASQPRTVAVQQDGQRVLTAQMTTADSVFVVEGLLPRRTYSYVAQRLRDTSVIDVSSPVQATMMDTTTHNFMFHLDTLGVTSSMLNDVAIVNDRLAYAVGEVYLRDSTGQFDDTPYNLAKWNGQMWSTQRVPVPLCTNGSGFFPLRSIHQFGPSDIWMTGGGDMIHWDGQAFRGDCSMNSLIQGAINKIWGCSSSDLYAVGNMGTIVHYSNGIWQRLESGTTVTLNDVWGGSNRLVGENVVVVAAGNKYTAGETKLLRISESGEVDTLPWNSQIRSRQSIWFSEHSRVYTCGSGVFSNNGSGWRLANGIPAIYTNRIRGNGENDIVVVGDFGLVAHFNGLTWHVYPEVGLPGGNYESVAMQGDLMIAVGWTGGRAVILRGVRSADQT